MNHIQPVGLKEGEDKATVLASLRRQLMEDLKRRHSPTPSPRGEPTHMQDVGTPGQTGLAAVRSGSSCSSSCSCSSERCGSADDHPMDFAARRKRSALMRRQSVLSKSSSATESEDGNGVEDLSAKMSRLHSPMKTESEGAVPPVAQAAPRSLLFSSSTTKQESAPISSTAASHASIPQHALVPYQAVRSSAQYPLVQADGTEAGTGTGMVLAQSEVRRVVLHDPKKITLGSGKVLTGEQYTFIKKEQRTSQNFWDSKWAFPTGDIFERASLLRARDFVCLGMHGCTVGDCCEYRKEII